MIPDIAEHVLAFHLRRWCLQKMGLQGWEIERIERESGPADMREEAENAAATFAIENMNKSGTFSRDWLKMLAETSPPPQSWHDEPSPFE